jgi:flagellar motor switch protein FliG
MSVYARFKRNQDGFRQLVELWETTPVSRRQRMIEVGRAEDAAFTEKVLQYVMTFEDVLGLKDMELAELIAITPSRMVGLAIAMSSEEIKARFLKNARPQVAAEIRDFMAMKIGLREVGGAQLKLVEKTRELERKGLIKTKKIPI